MRSLLPDEKLNMSSYNSIEIQIVIIHYMKSVLLCNNTSINSGKKTGSNDVKKYPGPYLNNNHVGGEYETLE